MTITTLICHLQASHPKMLGRSLGSWFTPQSGGPYAAPVPNSEGALQLATLQSSAPGTAAGSLHVPKQRPTL